MKNTCFVILVSFLIFSESKSVAQVVFNFGPAAGVNVSGVYNKKRYYESQTKEHHSFGVHPTLGITAGIFSQLQWKHLSFDLQVMYSESGRKNVVVNDPEVTTGFWYYYKNKRHYEFAYVQVPLTLNYHFRVRKMHPFLGVGIVPSYTIRAEGEQTYSHNPEMNYAFNIIEESKNGLFGYSPMELQFTTVIGIELDKRWQSSLSYTVGSSSEYFYPYSCTGESFSNKTLSLQLRYLIPLSK